MDLFLHIRKFKPPDAQLLWELKFRTIRLVNSKDYSQAQVEAWVPEVYDHANWFQRISTLDPFVAIKGDDIVGFADLKPSGYIDQFFCATDHIRTGVGRCLMEKIISEAEQQGIMKLFSHVSLTAKPFFERFGFKTVKQQEVEVRGVILDNFIMERCLS